MTSDSPIRYTFGANTRLSLRDYKAVQGQCVEINPPRDDKNCSSPAGSPVYVATGRMISTVMDWSGPRAAAQSSSTTAPRSSLILERHYSSEFAGLATPAQSRLGNGWRTGFDAVAVWEGALSSARRIHVMLPDFTEITYANAGGTWDPRDTFDQYIRRQRRQVHADSFRRHTSPPLRGWHTLSVQQQGTVDADCFRGWLH